MIVSFSTTKLAKRLNNDQDLERYFGSIRAKRLRARIASLKAAKNLGDFLPAFTGPERCHELTEGKRAGQLSMDLDHPYRLIFKPDHDPLPERSTGGLDWTQVTAIIIIGIEDTHE